MGRGRPATVYEARLDGELVARGTAEECAERVGVSAKTVQGYACASKSRPCGRIAIRRLGSDEAAKMPRFATKKPDPRISAEELRDAMRRRHDEMFGLLPDWEA